MPVEKAPKRADANTQSPFIKQRLEFGQRQIRRGLDLIQQKLGFRFNPPGFSIASLRLGSNVAMLAPEVIPTYGA